MLVIPLLKINKKFSDTLNFSYSEKVCGLKKERDIFLPGEITGPNYDQP
jgi:hypothetical protein